MKKSYFVFPRSANLDLWTTEQLRTISLGGNYRAQVFFNQHEWTGGGKIEKKYTSRAAELYRQLLLREVEKSLAEETSPPSLPCASVSMCATNELLDVNVTEALKECSIEKPVAGLQKAFSQTVSTIFLKKPVGAKMTKKTGGLGVRKLTSEV